MADARRVLVVDDSIVVCKLVEKILRSCGFEHVELAQDGELALEYLEKTIFDFIICDWEMQPMSGIDILNEVRLDRQFKKTRFILMSAKREPHWVLAAKKAGADAIIPKPFDPEMLMQKINQIGARA
jgi:two-component system chemotaxis response regulator CheY